MALNLSLPVEQTTRADLILDEGKRLKLYHDSRGIASIGIGRNLVANGISEDEAQLMLTNDMRIAEQGLDLHCPWWRTKKLNVQRVLWNLAFNMGITKLLTFGTFLHLLLIDDIDGAADDLEQTAWFGEVGERGPRMVQRLQGVI